MINNFAFNEIPGEKLDENYAMMFHPALNKSWKLYLTKKQLYGHLPPISQTIQVKRAKHVGLAVEVKTNS